MRNILFIAAGGGIGAVSRYLTSLYGNSLSKGFFPWGTLAVNLIGSFLIGLLFPLFTEKIPSNGLRAFLIIGFLGGYTTFSSYSLESVKLLMDGEVGLGLGNVLANNILGLVMAVAGIFVSRAVFMTVE